MLQPGIWNKTKFMLYESLTIYAFLSQNARFPQSAP